jgi:hypothetical protein
MRILFLCSTIVTVIGLGRAEVLAADAATAAAGEIAVEVRKRNGDPGGRPLPVVSHWANSFGRPNFSSDYQIGLLERGHHIMPTLPFPRPGAERYSDDGKPWVEKLARWKAPFSLRAGQWESVLYDKKHPVDDPGKWRRLPPEKSPLVVNLEGAVTPTLSPWGSVEPWYEAGVYNTSSGAFGQLQAWYPDPPLVILLSNNEARKLKPKNDIEAASKRYMDRHGPGRSAAHVRRAIAEGYVPRYAALLKGIRAGLAREAWRKNSLLVGYNAFGPPHFARWGEWTKHCYMTEDRISPWHLVWEGGSPSYYTHNWNASTDYRVHSPQVEANNWVFMLEAALAERPDFWFELSIWDGNPASGSPRYGRKKDAYLRAGQTWSPDRYAGFVQYGMWLLTPRVIREFRGSTVPRAECAADFEALVAAVDRVWTNPVLKRFWRRGALVPNRSRGHPYQARVPERWKNADRWFMLTTSLDPPAPWKLDTELPVFSLARVIGEGKDREWLLYAHAPVKARTNVGIEIPGYGTVNVDVTRGGSFHLVTARDGTVRDVTDHH